MPWQLRLGGSLVGSLSGSARHRYASHDDSSFLVGTNLEATAELLNSLAHSLNADSYFFVRAVSAWHSFALVAYFDLQLVSVADDPDRGNTTPRVTMNVCEAFLNNPEDGGFEFGGVSLEIAGIA